MRKYLNGRDWMYINSIRKAVEYIETNLSRAISLSDISSETGYSMFHFDRVFKYTLGESIIEYVRKRRLTEAAKELTGTDSRIIDIALKYGFDSQQAFSNAFKKYYKVSPGRYRKNDRNYALLEKKVLSYEEINRVKGKVEIEPRVIIKDKFLVMGMECFGANTHGEIPDLWDRFIARMGEIKHRKNKGVTLGICDHVEGYDPNKSEFSYQAGVEVKEYSFIPDGMILKEIPKQKYVVFTHRGSVKELEDTYRYIYSTYFFKSNHEPIDAPDFELYDERFKGEENDSEMEIYIPIKMTEDRIQ